MSNHILDHKQLCQYGLNVVEIEIRAIHSLKERIDSNFAQACEHLLSCKGRIILTGMGKSGHIARKIAATFASTGAPSFFIHAAEANHGDSGMITAQDVLIAISHSGETAELINLLPFIKRLGVPLICLSGSPNSTLVKAASVYLNSSVEEEACPLGLAPTSSTTATLVMGDALAITLLQARGFTAKDFALYHPGGQLGRRLLLEVRDIMRKGDAIPKIREHESFNTALIEMTRKNLGMVIIINEHEQIAGIYTDGDLRRTLNKGLDLHNTIIKEIMTINSKVIEADKLAMEALQIMETYKITSLPVVDEKNALLGVIHMHDLLSAGLT